MARPPKGPLLAQGLEGSEEARRQLEIILETVAGERTIEDACKALGMTSSAFHDLRTRALQGALGGLEPKPRGRPRKETGGDPEDDRVRLKELERRNSQLNMQLHVAHIREELALGMPHVFIPAQEAQKKREKQERQRQNRRKRRRKKRTGAGPSGGDVEGVKGNT